MPRPPRADETGGLYHALNRGRPLGDKSCVESIMVRLNLESTMRPRQRPKIQQTAETDRKEA